MCTFHFGNLEGIRVEINCYLSTSQSVEHDSLLCTVISLTVYSLLQPSPVFFLFLEMAITRAYIGDVLLLETAIIV